MRFNPNIAACAAVSAVGAAEFNKFFTAKRHGSSTTVTSADINFAFIKKFHGLLIDRLSEIAKTSTCATQKVDNQKLRQSVTESFLQPYSRLI